MGLDMLLHVETLDKSSVAIRTLVWFVSCVYFPVAVQGAWICKLFSTLFTLNGGFSIGTNLTSPKIRFYYFLLSELDVVFLT